MNTKLKFAAYPAIVLLSLAAAVSAHAAGDITPDDTATQVWAHTMTRSQVTQQLLVARAAEPATVTAPEYAAFAAAPVDVQSSTTRGEVMAEVRANRGADGARMTGEDSGSFYLSQNLGRQDARRLLAGSVRTGQ